MKHVTAEQMREIDRKAIGEYGIPSLKLMENAGLACFNQILELESPDSPLILAGKGNNGGDALVIARYFFLKGIIPRVIFFQNPSEMKEDPKHNYLELKKLDLELIDFSRQIDYEFLEKSLKEADVVVDGLFGTGLNTDLRNPYKQIVRTLNQSEAKIYAIDIPSGLDANTGKPLGESVRAFRTITLGLPKIGFEQPESKEYTGSVYTVDIGLPKSLLEEV